ncbi:putative ABC transport system permease protein [Kineococcus xinjiangensis]|uniref:Putative ABC transport system permease protein n=1 Tax=Kineococcus xinjiangensis TaxID=512762 RepID=A0A2S6IST7_9ACTN|nr:ABC transporter permease [Kineococcus xinjiangensis]PPK97215.1 putative ABC transport system permease protein [Kineococcus xinjiangensis]
MTSVVAALTEAWSEIRVHKVRVVLALVGVFLAVFAMTTITAVGNMGRQMLGESFERSAGRPATLRLDLHPNGMPSKESTARAERAVAAAIDRYDVRWHTTNGQAQFPFRFPDGAAMVDTTIVDPSYGTIHRTLPTAGRWFTPADAEGFAPRLVVNAAMAERLGGFDPARPMTVVLGGDTPVRATVIGVAETPWGGQMPAAFMLADAAERWSPLDPQFSGTPATELWVPSHDAEALSASLQQELSAALPGFSVGVGRSDGGDDLGILDAVLDYGVRGVGIFALVLGGIGVLNVGLVTVRQRIREIGVRRSFGATSTRVFVAVLLESVCATAAAGALAVALSVALVENFPLEMVLPPGLTLTDVPRFPFSAALEGFLAATAIGALAGVVPAAMAVRAKVIDAIRY